MAQAPPQTTEHPTATHVSETKLRGSARIDAAHPIAKGEPPLVDEKPVDVPIPLANETTLAEQLRLQAAQLAEYLRKRQEDLDRRESQLHGQQAELESDLRAARLWLAERQADLTERTDELARRDEQMQRCLARVASVENTQRQRAEELGAYEKQLREWEISRQQLAAEPSPEAMQSVEDAQIRRQQLIVTEQQWEELRHRTEQLYNTLQKDRQEFDEHRRCEQQRLEAEQRRAQEELDRKRQSLAQRSEQVDRCHESMEKLREELGQMHRSTLEIRLATEELWARLAGSAPPAALTRSLGQIRQQLAEDYQAATAALNERKQELIVLREDLCRQHERMSAEKRQLEQWLARQEEEIQQRAARLVAREQQLDAQQDEFRDYAQQWEMDRIAYQEEIVRLQQAMPMAEAF